MRSLLVIFAVFTALICLPAACSRPEAKVKARPLYGVVEHKTRSGMNCVVLTNVDGDPVAIACDNTHNIPTIHQPKRFDYSERVPL